MRALILALLLVGCSSIDRKVEGWPQDLKVTEIQTGFWDVQAKCWEDMPFYWKLMIPIVFACTVADLDKGTCDIYYWQDEMPDDLKTHERQHCQGYAHDSGWQTYYDAWKAKQ